MGLFGTMFVSIGRTERRTARRAAAATEYALVLALLVGGTLIAAHQLSGVQREAFGQIAETTSPVAGRPVSGDRAARARSAPEMSRLEHVTQYADYRLGFVLLAAGGLGLGVSWFCRVKRRAAERPATTVEPSTTPAALQSTVFEKRQLILRVLSKEQRLSADRIQIRHVMTTDAVRVRPNASLPDVREVMHGKRLRHVLVCDAREALLGVISDRDLSSRRGKTAVDVMSAHPVTVSPESLVVPAITWMINQHISCLPVVSDNRLVGVVTTTDLLLTLQCSLQLLEQAADDSHPDEFSAGAPATAAC